MKITIELPDLSKDEIEDIEYAISKVETSKIFHENNSYRVSIKKALDIVKNIKEIVEQQIINAG